MKYSAQSTPLLPFYHGNRLISDYLSNPSALCSYFQYEPALASFADVLEQRKKQVTDRNLLANVLKEQYSDYVTTITEKQIESLRSENTFTVVASHQPCLLLGPLYNALKICSTIHLANQLKQQFPQQHFVPVFWLGSEDHDLEELNHAFINGERIAIETEYKGAIGRMPSSEALRCYRQHETLLRTQMGDVLFNQIVASGERFETFGQHTHHLVHEIFGAQGLLVLDQDHAALKKKFANVMTDEAMHFRALNVLNEQVEQMTREYHAQARPRPINLFYLSQEGRNRLEKTDDCYKVLNTSLSFFTAEFQKHLKENPERFSPNVILRPLFQELVLPNLAFVGGGGEVSYWLELKPLFEHYGIHFPMLLLRNSAAFITQPLQRKIGKLNLTTQQLLLDEQTLQQQLLATVASFTTLETEKEKLNTLYAETESKAVGSDATLLGAVRAELQKALKGLEQLEAKLQRAEKRKHETLLQQLQQVYAQLHPNGGTQERSINFLPLLNNEPELVSLLVQSMNPLEKSFVFFSEQSAQD